MGLLNQGKHLFSVKFLELSYEKQAVFVSVHEKKLCLFGTEHLYERDYLPGIAAPASLLTLILSQMDALFLIPAGNEPSNHECMDI